MEPLAWSRFGVQGLAAETGTVAALGLCLAERCPRHDADDRRLVCCLSPAWTLVLLCHPRAGATGLGDTAPATCLVHSPGERGPVLHTPHFYFSARSPLGKGGRGSLTAALWKAGDSGDTMSPVRRGRQGAASASHKAPGLGPFLPMGPACMVGRGTASYPS